VSENKWEQPDAPPPPLFTGKKEKDLVKQVTDEVIERVIGISVLYYPISLKHSQYHPLYGEAINKTFLPPVHVDVLAEWEGEETDTTGFGIDKKSSVTLHFHKRRLTEDQNLFVREGDFIQYGEQKYEIVTLGQPRQLFGQPEAKIEIVAKCVRARDGAFPSDTYADADDDDPRLSAPACDPIEEIRVLTGDVRSHGGSGEQPCAEEYSRPGTPPPPLFTGKKETNLVKQVSDEILERVVGQQVVYFPVSVPHSNFHELYGESVNKTFLPPIRVFASVDWQGSETTTSNYGIDRKSSIEVKFHKRRLSEDQNLFVREGDFILYGNILYEIATVGQPRLLFGKIDEKFEVVASCIRAREGIFRLSEIEGVADDFDLDSVTACDNANLIIPDGVDNTMANVGDGEEIFKNKTGIQFNMKTLVAGDNIVLESTDDEIIINSAGEISGTITNAHTASIAHTASYYAETDTLDNVVGRGNVTTGSITIGHLSSSGIEFSGNIIPAGNEQFDIGSPDRKVRDLYLSTGSLVFGSEHKITIDSSTNQFDFSVGDEQAELRGEITNAKTASYIAASGVDGTVLSSSFAHTASYVIGQSVFGTVEAAQTASYVEVAQTASYVHVSDIDGLPETASFAHTASLALTAHTASYIHVDNIDGLPETASFSISSSFSFFAVNATTAETASFATLAATASYYEETDTLASVVARGATTTGSITVGELTASGFSAGGHYIPTDDNMYDIGTADKQIRDIYVSTGSIIFGGEHKIEVNSATNTFNFDSPISKGLTIPRVDSLDNLDYADGTMVYHTALNRFKFRQNSQWIEMGDNNNGGGGGGGSVIAGNGIFTISDDGDGPSRQLLYDLSSNAAGYLGRTIYVSNVMQGSPHPFTEGAKFYFNEGGIWHPSPFFSTGAVTSSLPATTTDLQGILTLDAALPEDYAILTAYNQDAGSYSGRAIYLSNTGALPVGDFIVPNKYYFNEGGTWYASMFHSEEDE